MQKDLSTNKYNYKTVVVATQSDEVSQIAWEATTQVSLRQIILTSDLNKAHMALLRGSQIAIVELSMLASAHEEILKVKGIFRSSVSIILIAKDEQEALGSGIEVRGSVFHIFLACPPVEHLRDILLAALRKQENCRRQWLEPGLDGKELEDNEKSGKEFRTMERIR